MLRKIRIALAAVFFVGITLLFVGIGQDWLGWMAKLQFLPSALALNFAVIIGILLLTFFFGRIYCSVICPMGVFQDVVLWIRRTGGKWLQDAQARRLKKLKESGSAEKPKVKQYLKRFSYVKEHKWVRYGVLVLSIVSIVLSGQMLIALIAPYSAYGRIVRSIAGAANGSVAPALLITGLVTLVVIFCCAWLWGREYCNTICPVGTTLSLVSRFSLYRHTIDTSKCINCGRCGKACKASCIDTRNHRIDYSRCVDCFDCIDNCSEGAIQYRFVGLGNGSGGSSEAKASSDARPDRVFADGQIRKGEKAAGDSRGQSPLKFGETGGLPIDEFPDGGLLGEDAHVLEGGQAQAQGEVQPALGAAVADVPLVVHFAQALPGAAVFLAGLGESGAGFEAGVAEPGPFSCAQVFVPEGFGLRTGEDIGAETFQLLAVSAVEEFVIFPEGAGVFDGHGFRRSFCR